MAVKIRDIMPNCGLSTDIIVGFPGETDDQYRETLDLMDAIKFNSEFTFKYSPRPYTKAEQFSDQISEEIKKARLDEMLNLQRKHSLELNKKAPAESYPLYSSFFNPSIIKSLVGFSPIYPTIPHIIKFSLSFQIHFFGTLIFHKI